MKWWRGWVAACGVFASLVPAGVRGGVSPGTDAVIAVSAGFEDGSGGFTSGCFGAGVSNCLWRRVDPIAHTGTYAFHVDDVSTAGESWLMPIAPLAISLDATAASLTFWHMYDFEYANDLAYDGGVIEVSTDLGATWTDAGEQVLLNGYTGTIAEASGTNSLRNRAAWVGRAGAWIEVRVDLMPFRGMSLLFRFRLGTDLSNLREVGGWWVDDVRLSYTVPATDCGRGWSSASAYPVPVSAPAAVGLGDRLYVFGGSGGAPPNPVATAYTYSTADDQWTLLAPLPAARRRASAVTDGTSIYILGGYDTRGERTSTLWRYDPSANNYTTLSPSLTPAAGHAAVYLDGVIYRIGGLDDEGDSGVSTVEAYSIDDDAWSTVADYPQFLYGVSAVAVGNFIYTAGGVESSVRTEKTYRYDPAADAWDDGPIADAPGGIVFGAAAVYRGMLFLARDGFGLAWDPATNRWRSIAQAPLRLTFSAAAVTDSGFYVIGGTFFETLENTDAVQRYVEVACVEPTPTATPRMATPGTATPAGPGCLGDCDSNGAVIIADLVKGVSIALGLQPLDACGAMDGNDDGQVAVNEIVQAVNNALNGC